MNKTIKSAALAAVLAAGAWPVATAAQTLPPAVIVVVDMDQVINGSVAGKQAQAELKTRADALQSRINTLRTQFGSEEETLAKGAPAQGSPPATIQAFQAKVKDFQTRRQAAEQEVGQRERDFQASRNYVLKQINDAAQPIITAIMRERGASIAMPEAATLQHAASVEVTTDVIARLDKALPRVSTTAPAQPAAAPQR